MTVNTKFDVGDTCFMMYNNKILEVQIKSIFIRINEENPFYNKITWITYVLEDIKGLFNEFNVEEDNLYATKHDLAEDLIS